MRSLQVLPNVSQFPKEFVQNIIDLLNRGSISTLDPRDVLGEEYFLFLHVVKNLKTCCFFNFLILYALKDFFKVFSS